MVARAVQLSTKAPRGEIRQGDAFDLIRKVEDESVDLVITSPPYWGLRTYNLPHEDGTLAQWSADGCHASRTPPYEWYRSAGGVLGLEPFPEWYIAHLTEFFSRARRTLKAHGSLWVNLGDTYFARWGSIREGGRQGLSPGRTRRRTPSGGYLHDKQLLMIPARFAIAMQDCGWILRNDLIWVKPSPLPRPEKDRLRSTHEHWFHFVLRNSRSRPRYYYDLDACEDDAVDVVFCQPASGIDGHSATFPSELVRRRIESTSPLGGAVLDPFCGTGTAVVEAAALGRVGVGFELSKAYAQAATKRVKGIKGVSR